jgi:5-methylthioribose kinase
MQDTLTEANVFEYLETRFPAAAGAGDAGRRCEPVGDGNINWVRRVRAGTTSFVVKQAGATLEKFPEYEAPPERILHEARYFEAVGALDAERVCPAVHHVDAERHVLVLEDLGDVERLDAALRRGDDAGHALCRIARFLGAVHAGTRDAAVLARFPDPARDGGVLALHREHIFRLPFQPNDFPLSPAVREAGDALASDAALRERIAAVETASRVRTALVHGDVQPTNILLAARGAVLLDAEIAHGGSPAFDLGLLLGHVALACVARGAPDRLTERAGPVWRAYLAAGGSEVECRVEDVAAVAGVEVLRRTLGAARVPEVTDDAVALEALQVGRDLMLGKRALA